MRKLVVCHLMSLDGYYGGPGKDGMALAAALGAGTPLFDGLLPAALRLIEIRSWDDSENVLVKYEVHAPQT